MNIKYLDFNNYLDKIEKLYLNSFPKSERFPFWILKESSKSDNSNLSAIIVDNVYVGMCYMVNCMDAYYIMYFAIEPNLRNKKYGSEILKNLKEKYKILFLSIEKSNDDIGLKRRNFYLKNGFHETNKYYEDNGVCYEILCTDDKYEINDKVMNRRYINMTNDPKLINEITKIFNVSK